MPRGKKREVGSVRVAQNGYRYIQTENGQRLLHHVIAETKLGRPLRPDERVYFVDGNRAHIEPDNLSVERAKKHKLAQLYVKSMKLQKDLDYVLAELKEMQGYATPEETDLAKDEINNS